MKINNIIKCVIALSILLLFGCETFDKAKYGDFDNEWDLYDAAKAAWAKNDCPLAVNLYTKAIQFDESKGIFTDFLYILLAEVYGWEGKYKEAIQISNIVEKIPPDRYQKDKYRNLIDIAACYRDMGKYSMDWGDFNRASEYFAASSSFADKYDSVAPPTASTHGKFLYTVLGRYYISQGEYAKAEEYLNEYLESLVKRGAHYLDIGKAQNNLAKAYYYSRDYETAKDLFMKAERSTLPDEHIISLSMLS